jgi:hypothetical protein
MWGIIEAMSESDFSTDEARALAKRVMERADGWRVFKERPTESADDLIAADWLAGLIQDEQARGSFVMNLVYLIPSLESLHGAADQPGSDIVFLARVLIGVAAVFAVFIWTAHRGEFEQARRALAIIHLWQGVDGYNEVGLLAFSEETMAHIKAQRLDRESTASSRPSPRFLCTHHRFGAVGGPEHRQPDAVTTPIGQPDIDVSRLVSRVE